MPCLVHTRHVLFDALHDDRLNGLFGFGLDGDEDVPALHQVSYQSGLTVWGGGGGGGERVEV